MLKIEFPNQKQLNDPINNFYQFILISYIFYPQTHAFSRSNLMTPIGPSLKTPAFKLKQNCPKKIK